MVMSQGAIVSRNKYWKVKPVCGLLPNYAAYTEQYRIILKLRVYLVPQSGVLAQRLDHDLLQDSSYSKYLSKNYSSTVYQGYVHA